MARRTRVWRVALPFLLLHGMLILIKYWREGSVMYLGENIKKLGFGLMRMPQKDGVIDVEQVKVIGAGGAGKNPDHPLHDLQLLREGLPAGHRHFRLLHRDELFDALRRQSGGPASGKLARKDAREKARRRMRKMRRLRESLPAAYRDPHGAGSRRKGAGVRTTKTEQQKSSRLAGKAKRELFCAIMRFFFVQSEISTSGATRTA